MKLVLSENEDNNKMLYIVMKSDNSSDYFVYSKDYINKPNSDWENITSDIKDAIALLSEFDITYENKDYKELKIHHTASFCRQIQREMQEHIANNCKELSQNLKNYEQCRQSILEAVSDAYKYNLICYDIPELIDYMFFSDNWKSTFGTDFIPSKNKDNGNNELSL